MSSCRTTPLPAPMRGAVYTARLQACYAYRVAVCTSTSTSYLFYCHTKGNRGHHHHDHGDHAEGFPF
ncbi:MAG: hypothetical protein ACOYW7_05380 [Nitrospirota bacterium]